LNLAGIDARILEDPNKRKEVETFVNENKEAFEKLPRHPSSKDNQGAYYNDHLILRLKLWVPF